MAGFNIHFLVEVNGLSEVESRDYRLSAVNAALYASDYEFDQGFVSGLADSIYYGDAEDLAEVVFGAEDPEKIIKIASEMQDRAKKRAFAMMEQAVKSGIREAKLEDTGKAVGDYTLNELAGLYDAVQNRGTMTYLTNCAVQELRNHPHAETEELVAVEYLHDEHLFPTGSLHIFPDEVEMEYIRSHPEDFAYLETTWGSK